VCFGFLEQIPGYIEKRDCTDHLQQDGYWASYNRPFFDTIRAQSKWQYFQALHADMFSYRENPRARIFAREQSSVQNICDMKRVMRFNQYQTDPLSEGCPGNAIAARHDLMPVSGRSCDISPESNGATDAKITCLDWISKLKALAVVGPTSEGQAPFDWNKQGYSQPEGLPSQYLFSWEPLVPSTLDKPASE